MPPNGPMRSYLQAVRGHPAAKSGPLTAERVVEFGLPLGLDSLGRLSRESIDYATEFVLGLENVIADLPKVERAVATQYFFGSGSADNRQAAAVESLKSKNTPIARSRPRLAQDRVITLVADGLLASDWFGSYRQELFGGRRRVSYGFALRSLHLTLVVGPDDPSDITFTHDLSIRILKDRVRLIPRRYGWSGPSENELPPALANPRQRILFDTASGKPGPVCEDEFSYYFIYLGRPYSVGESPRIQLTQRFTDPQQAMRPVFRYVAEQEGAWKLTLELVLPRSYADTGILFEILGGTGKAFPPRRWLPGDPRPAPGITCVTDDRRVVAVWTDAAPRSGGTYFMGWERP